MATSRILNFWTLPLTVIRNPPTNFQCRGILLGYHVSYVGWTNLSSSMKGADLVKPSSKFVRLEGASRLACLNSRRADDRLSPGFASGHEASALVVTAGDRGNHLRSAFGQPIIHLFG